MFLIYQYIDADVESFTLDHIPSDNVIEEMEEVEEEKESIQEIQSNSIYKSVSDDPVDWKMLNSQQHQLIIERDPVQIKRVNFPIEAQERHFSNFYYKRIMSNGETFERKWLVYSEKSNCVFCYCCVLFNNSDSTARNWSVNGYSDWKNISRALKIHESSKNHLECVQKWMELDIRLKTGKTIDEEHKRLLEIERRHWREVLKTIVATIQLCSSQMLAFRGTSDKLFEKNNGNFLKIMELLGKFVPVVSEHLNKAATNVNCINYLSKEIQSNIINLMGQKVQNIIVSKIKDAKYYSIILDCIPDVSKIEQMSLVIRIVSYDKDEGYIPNGYFIEFLPVMSTTGAGLTEVILQELDKLGLKIEVMRGQGYDNGANMKGIHSGVQQRILNENPKTFFVPFSCHSLNLVINDAAKKSSELYK